MKLFVKNILIFIIVPLFIIVTPYFIYHYQLNKIRFDKNKSIVLCGDSHTQTAINDSSINSLINISQSAEHYFYTYNVLDYLLNKNKNIKTIIIGTSFHSFSKYYDNFISKEDLSKTMYPRYFPILNKESVLELLNYNTSSFFKSSVFIYKNIATSLILNAKYYNEYSFCGKYYASSGRVLNDSTTNTTIQMHYFNSDNTIQEFSLLQKYYLSKIANLCKENNIRLVLINTPLTEQYKSKIPKPFIDNFYTTINTISKKYTIEFWDYHNFKIDEKHFGDSDHLNYNGAIHFTNEIKNKLIVQ